MVIGNEADAATECMDCHASLETMVLSSAAGYYLGTQCPNCGPYARESDYFATREDAAAELRLWNATGVKPSARTPGYFGGAYGG